MRRISADSVIIALQKPTRMKETNVPCRLMVQNEQLSKEKGFILLDTEKEV